MKYPFRYLFALVALVAMLVQGGRALQEHWWTAQLIVQRQARQKEYGGLKDAHDEMTARASFYREINDRYEYPGDLPAIERRYQSLQQPKAGR
jgi:hypothetical protein